MLKLRRIKLSAPLLVEEETQRPVKAVIKHLADSTSSEDMTVALQELDYDVISVKQNAVKRPSPEGGVTHIALPLLLVNATEECKRPINLQIDITVHGNYKDRGL
jgi:hypothetical protein